MTGRTKKTHEPVEAVGSGPRRTLGSVRKPPLPPARLTPGPRITSNEDLPTLPDTRPAETLRALSRPSLQPGVELTIEPGTLIGNKYQLKRAIGTGGMGTVWEAVHLTLDTPVAIKFMAPPDTEESIEGSASPQDPTVLSRRRFEREAKAAAQMRMANVVSVLDYGIEQMQPYLVMELLHGEDLGARLKQRGRLSLSEVRRILVPVARALQRAHDRGLLHRDLKPANIFLAREGEDEIPKLLDFGLAKPLQGHDVEVGDATSEGTVVGTAYYASPEQALGRTDIDHRSDLWSLSVVLFQALTGSLPFRAAALLEAVVEVCSNPIPAPSQVAPDLPAEVDEFFARALCRDLEGRYQSAQELADAYEAMLERATTLPKRKRRAAPMLMMVASLGALGFAGNWWLTQPAAPALGSPAAEQELVARPNEVPSPSWEPEQPIADPTEARASESPVAADPSPTDDAQPDPSLEHEHTVSPVAHTRSRTTSVSRRSENAPVRSAKPKRKLLPKSEPHSNRRELGY